MVDSVRDLVGSSGEWKSPLYRVLVRFGWERDGIGQGVKRDWEIERGRWEK
jgi:hypothetical protein